MFTLMVWTLISKAIGLQPGLERDWHWITKPSVEICPDSDISVNQVIDVLEYWLEREVDVTIASIQKVKYCDETKFNVVQINGHIDFDLEKYHAMTDVKWHYYGIRNDDTIYYIDRVQIQLPNDILENRTIVRHEFGHAMGLGHSDHPVMKKKH